MEKQVHLHEFRLQLTRGQTAVLLSAVFVALLIEPIATEDITMSTYYPAPAGAYNNMVTIGNTWLARDPQPGGAPSFVEIGSNSGIGSNTKMAVMGGNVGIGTTNPGQGKISSGSFPILDVDGFLSVSGNDSGNGVSTISSEVGGLPLRFKARGGNYMDLVVAPSGNVGIGTNSPQASLDIEPAAATCCNSYGCHPCANPLRINYPQNSVTPGSVWTAQNSYGDGAWQNNASLNCNQYATYGHSNPTYAYCPSNTQMTGGGCSCNYGTILTSYPASSNSWNCWCTGLNYAGAPSPWAYSYAICCQ